MATTIHENENEVSILARFLSNEEGRLPEDVARYIVNHEISERDRERMHFLAVQNQNDELTVAEKEELHGFAKAATLLSILKSKARKTLEVRALNRPGS